MALYAGDEFDMNFEDDTGDLINGPPRGKSITSQNSKTNAKKLTP